MATVQSVCQLKQHPFEPLYFNADSEMVAQPCELLTDYAVRDIPHQHWKQNPSFEKSSNERGHPKLEKI
jgi:hypothetical protein